MKHLICLYIFSCFMPAMSCKQKQPERTFVRPDEGFPVSEMLVADSAASEAIAITKDGNIAVLATENNHDTLSGLLTMFTQQGKQIWKLAFRKRTYPSSLIITASGKIFVAGDLSISDGNNVGWICCIDSGGKLVWEKTDPTISKIDDMVSSAGGLTILGGTDLQVSHWTEDGKKIWSNEIAYDVNRGKSLFAARNGFILSTSAPLDTTDIDFHLRLYKLSLTGKVEWQNDYKIGKSEMVKGMFENADGNFYFVGVCDDTLMKEMVMTMRIDKSGKLLNSFTTGWQDDAARIDKAVSDAFGNMYFTGQLMNFRVSYRMFAGKVDSTGKLLWTRSIATPYEMRGGRDIAILPNGQLAMLGYSGNKETVVLLAADGGKAERASY